MHTQSVYTLAHETHKWKSTMGATRNQPSNQPTNKKTHTQKHISTKINHTEKHVATTNRSAAAIVIVANAKLLYCKILSMLLELLLFARAHTKSGRENDTIPNQASSIRFRGGKVSSCIKSMICLFVYLFGVFFHFDYFVCNFPLYPADKDII